MDIYEYAMQMEKDGENYYRELVKLSKTAGLQKIFAMLAEEEVKHFQFIEMLRQQSGLPKIKDSGILKNVKNVFLEMKETQHELHINTTEEANAYRKAREIEEMSRKFYQQKSEETADEQARMLFTLLAREEEKHYNIMDNIIEFVTRQEPGHWLENAEWHHLEEY